MYRVPGYLIFDILLFFVIAFQHLLLIITLLFSFEVTIAEMEHERFCFEIERNTAQRELKEALEKVSSKCNEYFLKTTLILLFPSALMLFDIMT